MKDFYKVGLRAENIYNLSVLTQAWKKANFFMRNDNWYTDFLELDNYSFNLETKLLQLRKDVKEKARSNEIDLIPVPKNDPWIIDNSKGQAEWKLRKDKNRDEIELRKIAKTSIDSQILSMSALMNLAELVENMQRRINDDPIEASYSKVYSYGNRLDCHWEYDGEKFRSYFKTGSKYTYEKYQKNYKLFINRPTAVCKYYNEGLDLSKKMVTISLDLKNFYDSIDLPTLYKKIDNIVGNYAGNNFSKDISDILKWTNNNQDFKGLPQGLAASGFFANVFLIDFDNEIGKEIVTLKKSDSDKIDLNSKFIVRDYCRYVDDLRIVLEVNKNQSVEKMKDYIHKIINKVITLHYPDTDLKLRDSKTEITEYLSSNTYPISDDLIFRRQNLSGTPSVEDIKENINAFKHLLLMDRTEYGTQQVSNLSGLGQFAEISFDLKTTTIQRFAATELKRNIKVANTYKRTIHENYDYKEIKELEAIAKLLIRNWLYNPSLMHLLKTALEIHCSISLMKPILDTLLEKMKKRKVRSNSIKDTQQDIDYEYATAVYASSQILTYTVTKLDKLKNGINKNRFIDFKEYLISFALNILDIHKDREIPWYLMQSITFLLVSENRHFEIKDINHKNFSLYKIYKEVSNYMIPNFANNTQELVQYLSMAIIYQQVSKEKEKFSSWYIKLISKYESSEDELNYLVFNYDKNLFEEIIKSDTYYNKMQGKVYYKKYFEVEKGKSLVYKNNQKISLSKVILSLENPFRYENALLLLLSNLLKDEHAKFLKEPVFLNDINVICECWDDIQDPNKYTEGFLKIEFVNEREKSEPNAKNLYERNLLLADFPFWLKDEGHFKTWFEREFLAFYNGDNNYSELPRFDEFVDVISSKVPKYSGYLEERKILYSIGKIVKSAIIGDYDYTNIYVKKKEERGYIGIKNTIYSRSFGLNISLNTLSGGESPISPWLVDVLFNNLRWPYAYRTLKIDTLFTYNGLKKKIKEIIDYQKNIYGDKSNLPINIYPISNPDLSKKDTLRVASIQTMMPFIDDFDSKNPLYFSTEYRNKHREHLINLTHLIEKHFSAQEVKVTKDLRVDLIIFPELSIQNDDIDLLVKLSRKTGASIFAGLTFTTHPTDPSKIINRAIWILNDALEDGTADIKKIYQGKHNVTKGEEKWGINKYRPYQVVIDLKLKSGNCKISGSICYDATDINLAADLKNITDTYIVAAMNKDVPTFDNMASALSYHMYQPVILVNTGEYGGSTVQAPYSGYEKLIAHLHGNKQLGISIFDISPNDFKHVKEATLPKKRKTPPANYPGRS